MKQLHTANEIKGNFLPSSCDRPSTCSWSTSPYLTSESVWLGILFHSWQRSTVAGISTTTSVLDTPSSCPFSVSKWETIYVFFFFLLRWTVPFSLIPMSIPFSLIQRSIPFSLIRRSILYSLIRSLFPFSLIGSSYPFSLIQRFVSIPLIRSSFPFSLIRSSVPFSLIRCSNPFSLIRSFFPFSLVSITSMELCAGIYGCCVKLRYTAYTYFYMCNCAFGRLCAYIMTHHTHKYI